MRAPDQAAPAHHVISLGGGIRVDYPIAAHGSARNVMRANRRRDTKPEVRLRSVLHRRGLRFRKDAPVSTDLRTVRVDIVFPRQRVAVFVDGCFWHCCPVHGTRPRTNGSYWQAKLDRNVSRDDSVNDALQRAGWNVIRIWEHENADEAAAVIEEVLR